MSAIDVACEALRRGKILELHYDGYSRCVEVHTVGVSKSGGQIMCCWQVRGGSVSHESVGWKLMKLDDVQSVHISEESSSAPRQGYKQGDKRMARIVCEL